MMASKPHCDEGWLREKYFEENMSVPEMADLAGVHSQTVYQAMDRAGIERDPTRYGDQTRVPYASYYLDDQGYPRWQSKTAKHGQYGRQTDNFHVHRLLAIAEFGVEATAGMDVHHRNDIPWDNRPENLELLPHGQHRERHGEYTWTDKLAIIEQYRNTELSQYDLAEVWDCTQTWISEIVRGGA